jgi:hypothetical protein
MLDIQYPIDPSMDEQGRIRVLIPILGPSLGPDAARPVALPELGGSWDIDVNARVADTSAYAKLGVSGMLSGQSTLDRKTAVWDALIGKNAVAGARDPATAIYQTFWGVGLRISIIFHSTEIEASASIASIAASAEYRKVDVQYEITSIGLGPVELAEVLSTIPPLGQFDMNAYAMLENVRTKLTRSLQARLEKAANPGELLQPAIVSLKKVPFTDELTEAAEYRFTMQSIASGLTLAQALARLGGDTWRTVRRDQVQALYAKVAGGEGAPPARAREEARKWLSITG